jgi:hypothetical protein
MSVESALRTGGESRQIAADAPLSKVNKSIFYFENFNFSLIDNELQYLHVTKDTRNP